LFYSNDRIRRIFTAHIKTTKNKHFLGRLHLLNIINFVFQKTTTSVSNFQTIKITAVINYNN
jgi:hypothetical protein